MEKVLPLLSKLTSLECLCLPKPLISMFLPYKSQGSPQEILQWSTDHLAFFSSLLPPQLRDLSGVFMNLYNSIGESEWQVQTNIYALLFWQSTHSLSSNFWFEKLRTFGVSSSRVKDGTFADGPLLYGLTYAETDAAIAEAKFSQLIQLGGVDPFKQFSCVSMRKGMKCHLAPLHYATMRGYPDATIGFCNALDWDAVQESDLFDSLHHTPLHYMCSASSWLHVYKILKARFPNILFEKSSATSDSALLYLYKIEARKGSSRFAGVAEITLEVLQSCPRAITDSGAELLRLMLLRFLSSWSDVDDVGLISFRATIQQTYKLLSSASLCSDLLQEEKADQVVVCSILTAPEMAQHLIEAESRVHVLTAALHRLVCFRDALPQLKEHVALLLSKGAEAERAIGSHLLSSFLLAHFSERQPAGVADARFLEQMWDSFWFLVNCHPKFYQKNSSWKVLSALGVNPSYLVAASTSANVLQLFEWLVVVGDFPSCIELARAIVEAVRGGQSLLATKSDLSRLLLVELLPRFATKVMELGPTVEHWLEAMVKTIR